MGRAIVRDPKVFLFDEPLSNLDAKLRVQMRTEIKKVHQKVRTTTVYVTHDQIEAMTLADRVVVMNARRDRTGRLAQRSLPFAGDASSSRASSARPPMNFIACQLEQAAGALRVRLNDQLRSRVPAERTARYTAHVEQANLMLGLRPEHITEINRMSNPTSTISTC